MANAIEIRWILLRMKSKGGEEAAVNPLDLLCLTDSIVLFLFLVATNSPLRHRHTEVQAMNETICVRICDTHTDSLIHRQDGNVARK